ncbi:MAG: vanadium-dependent haloperoxidase [Steroidobacteraceae bacterium]
MGILRLCARLAVIGLLCASEAAAHDETPPDVVLAWNQRVLAIAEAEDGFLTLKGVRAAAMMHIAMHDAVNSISRRFAAYAWDSGQSDADPVAAAAQAAFDVAVNQYPDQAPKLQSELDRWLATVADDPSRTTGIALGSAAAGAILELREADGWDRDAQYRWQPMAPGVYAEFNEHSGTPEGFVFGAGWAEVQPLLMRRADQFRSPPPPAIDSHAYAVAFDEVKAVGRHQSRRRTADQTHLALWWKEFVESSHNRLARELVPGSCLDLWEAARLFALLNMSIMDAYIGSFDAKFFHNHWRPYTAIRWAAHDGNPRTEPEPHWNNTHGHTYAFPSYPSAHGTACAAAMTIMGKSLGDRRAFTMTIPLVDQAGPGSPKIAPDPPTRSFDSFQAAAMECALSRVYLGIHFRYDSIEGNRLGSRIGNFGWKNHLVPVRRR